MLISLKNTSVASPVIFDTHKLDLVNTHKHLGITLNKNLTWSDHIDNIFTSANKKVALLSKLKNLIDRRTLHTMYTSFIRPSLEYGSIIWNNCSEIDSDRPESIQRRAARIITGGIIRTPSALLYEEVGLEHLSKRRDKSLLLFFHKIMFDKSPEYLLSLKPTPTHTRHNRNLRTGNELDIPKSRIEKYKNSVIPKAITLWNQLSPDIKGLANYKLFKEKLDQNIPQTNQLFFMGNRKTNIILARLRMKCSDLKGHLFQLKIIDNPTCKCGYFYEDSIHYFFVCPRFTQQRNILHNYVIAHAPFTLQILLNGSPDLDNETNTDIYQHVIRYIEGTKRFD